MIQYSSKYKLLLRLITSPIILALMLVTYLVNTIKMFVMFIRYGGEWITYDKTDIEAIKDIFQKLKENNNE